MPKKTNPGLGLLRRQKREVDAAITKLNDKYGTLKSKAALKKNRREYFSMVWERNKIDEQLSGVS